MQVPFLNLQPAHSALQSEMTEAFQRVYNRNRFVLGSELAAFEAAYAQLSGVSHAVGVSSGLDALFLALKACGIGAGDEVIVPAHTYIGTWLAVSRLGAIPVPVEPDPITCNIDPQQIAQAITPATRAIIPVHLYGQACAMQDLIDIAAQYQLKVVEDNAQAHLATFDGKPTGSWGHANASSFYPAKNLGALGDAGAVTTNDEAIAEKIRNLRNYGSPSKYIHQEIGYNMRLDELQAAFLSVKIRSLHKWTVQRQAIAAFYQSALQGIGDLILPAVHPLASHVYHLYVVRTAQRDALQHYLAAHGIGTLIHYPTPPHLQPAYRDLGFRAGDFPIAEQLAATCLSLPVWPGMSEAQLQHVSSTICQFYNQQ